MQPDAIVVEDNASVLEPRSQAQLAAEETLAAITGLVEHSRYLEFWQHRLAPEQVHFQAFTCARYATRHRIALAFLGDPAAEPDSLGDATALAQLDSQTLHGMATFDWQAAYAADYARARRDLEAKGCIEFLVPVDQRRVFYERDRALAIQLEQLEADRLAVVCGVPHLYFSDGGLTLYMQLGNGTAPRYLIDGLGEIRDYAIAHPF